MGYRTKQMGNFEYQRVHVRQNSPSLYNRQLSDYRQVKTWHLDKNNIDLTNKNIQTSPHWKDNLIRLICNQLLLPVLLQQQRWCWRL